MMKDDAMTAPAAAFAHVQEWIFDLDNTLYPAACNLFAQVDVRITDFIASELGLDAVAAKQLQKDYYRRFGTSLRGMMLDHGTDPERFLHYVHDIDVTALPPSPALATAIGALPGRKLIYTNGSVRHAENVMTRLGIAQHFTGIFDIVAADYRPKPDPQPYAEMVARFGIDSRRAAFVEDLHRNLVPPAAMGMTTVWLRADSAFSHPENKIGEVAAPIDHPGDHVHHIIDDLEEWLVGLSTALSAAPAR
jgi:putative hydrolase of the HAD superfamily